MTAQPRPEPTCGALPRLDAEEADAHLIDRPVAAQEVPPAQRQQPAVHAREPG